MSNTDRSVTELAAGGLAPLVRPDGYRTLSEQAFAALHAAILSGTLAPGQRLPITELAAQLGMSPMPIREAMRQLSAVGLVENVPHRGARVTDLSVDDLREVYEARLALEPLAVRKAAGRLSPQEAERAAADLRRLADAYRDGDADAAWSAHTSFHFTLYAAASSRWLERLITPLWESSERYRRVSAVGRGLRERNEEHEAILAACVAGDAERAAATLHDHLARTANLIAREMGVDELFALRAETLSA
jgi:DNA-binding GntR family transcriptional regulator